MLAKLISNCVCYPIESCKILSQTQQPIPVHAPLLLYNGYPCFVVYNLFHSWMYYRIFFGCLDWAALCWNADASLRFACGMTSMVTAIYKLPFNFYLRNRAAQKTVDWDNLRRDSFKLYSVMVLEDAPDTFLKFCLNQQLRQIAWMTDFHISAVIGVVTAMCLTPLDFVKTRLLCNAPSGHLLTGWGYRLISNLVNATLFIWIFNALGKI